VPPLRIAVTDRSRNFMRDRLPQLAGQMGAAYVIPVIYVPLLMITRVVAFVVTFSA